MFYCNVEMSPNGSNNFLHGPVLIVRTIGLNQKGGAKMDKMDFNAEIMGILNDVLAQQERIIKAVKLLSEEIEKMKSENK